MRLKRSRLEIESHCVPIHVFWVLKGSCNLCAKAMKLKFNQYLLNERERKKIQFSQWKKPAYFYPYVGFVKSIKWNKNWKDERKSFINAHGLIFLSPNRRSNKPKENSIWSSMGRMSRIHICCNWWILCNSMGICCEKKNSIEHEFTFMRLNSRIWIDFCFAVISI